MAAVVPVVALADSSGGNPMEKAFYETLILVSEGRLRVLQPWRLWTSLTRARRGFVGLGQQDLF